MRIRKRSAASSSGKAELSESSNGCLHLQAISACNPSSYSGPTSSVIPHPGIRKEDHSLLPGPSYGALHRSSQKQALAKTVSSKRKLCTDVSAGVQLSRDNRMVMMAKEDRNPGENRGIDEQHSEAKHMHADDNNDGKALAGMLYIRGCNELGILGLKGEEENLSGEWKKAKHGVSRKGSALMEEIYAHGGLSTVDATECFRKVRPLQLFLGTDHNSPTAPKFSQPLCPTSSSNINRPCTPRPLPGNIEKISSSVLVRTPPLISSAGGTSQKQIAEVEPQDQSRHLMNEDSSSSEQSRADLNSCQPVCTRDRDVATWQGHGRRRSRNMHGGRRLPYCSPGVGPGASVNAASANESSHETDTCTSEQQITKMKGKQIKRKPLDSLVAPQLVAPPSHDALRTAELKGQACLISRSQAHTQDPFSLSTSASCDLLTANTTRSVLQETGAFESKLKSTAVVRANAEQIASVPPSASADQVLQHDFVQCRRKDGRRWQCKAQVVKPGAPFCHYHTIKMREKRAASAARKVSKQLQGEVRFSMSHADITSRSSRKRVKKLKRAGSPPSIKAAHEICEVAAADNKDESKGGAEDVEEEENKTDDEEQTIIAEKRKQVQMQESNRVVMKPRWRKKCKPCIRRLHEIHDRARSAGTDVQDLLNLCKVDTLYAKEKNSPVVRACSPLPKCLLNTDPYEWRSDFL